MPKYILDTGLYIRATREDPWNTALEQFAWNFAPFIYLHSTVANELLAGALSTKLERRTQELFIEPFEATRRVITPTHRDWKQAGLVVPHLVRMKKLTPQGVTRSFPNDCLIAASARELGVTVITENERDFRLISTVLPVKFCPPWPQVMN
ncbi:MAG TPA: type II toxin-antitoxin system VapC family toxin [Longimicrobium sp.]|nr:type II toxin-antitoxin system VapC family toxin [Longimicrobium sp.]